MTKHEAIEVLEEVKMFDDSMFAYNQAYNDALEMAIEALKAQESVEPKNVNHYIDFDGEGNPFTPETYDCDSREKELPWEAILFRVRKSGEVE